MTEGHGEGQAYLNNTFVGRNRQMPTCEPLRKLAERVRAGSYQESSSAGQHTRQRSRGLEFVRIFGNTGATLHLPHSQRARRV